MGLGMLAPDSSLQTKLPPRDTERWRLWRYSKISYFPHFSDGGQLSPLGASNFVGRVCQRSVDPRQQSSITVPLVAASPLSRETPRCAPPPFPLNSHLARQPTTNWNQLFVFSRSPHHTRQILTVGGIEGDNHQVQPIQLKVCAFFPMKTASLFIYSLSSSIL